MRQTLANWRKRFGSLFKRKRKSGSRQRLRRGPARSWWPLVLRVLILAMIWGGAGLLLVLAWYAHDLPDIHQIEGKTRRPAITVLAMDGSRIARFGDFFADQISVGTLPPTMIQAVVAVEDRRFFDHLGLDPLGMLRAVFVNLRAGHLVQGGSTITQQLAKNLFLTPERTLRRKIQEALLAFWLEHEYSKDQILAAYLNRVYLGAGAYGVSAAAETYFNKPIEQITLYESALLAGLLKAPSRYAPTNDPVAARDRAATVLSTMIDAGYITAAQRDAAMKSAAGSMPKPTNYDARYFAAWIAEQVEPYAKTLGQDLIIETTLAPKIQSAAERAMSKMLREARQKKKNVTQAALLTLAVDGAVRAYIGGGDYDDSEFDRVTSARRQPGSSFKPFVYLTSILQNGLSPESTVYDEPIDIGDYAPDNYQGKYFGAVTAREAMTRSMNSVAVRLMQQAGIDATRRTAQKLGITTPLGKDLSLALGTSEVTLYDMVAAYGTIANAGKSVSPYAIETIRTRDNKIIYRRALIPMPQIVPAAATATLVEMMQGVLQASGTGARAAIGRPAAGKTGTTQNYKDAWFVGFTADYVTGVWVGNDNNKPMRKITGGSLPAGLWHDVMQTAEAELPARDLPVLENKPARIIAPADSPLAASGPPLDVADELGGLIGRILGRE
jgi:penicillin-binding protein 1A